MSNWFNYISPKSGQQHFADIDYKRMHGQQGVGFYRWVIGLHVVIHQPKESDGPILALENVAGDLYLTRPSLSDLLVARFNVIEKRNQLIAKHFNSTEEFSIEVELDGRRINSIEELRQGSDMQFELKLTAMAVDTNTDKRFPANVDIRFQANQSDWSMVLAGMQYRKTMLLEIVEPDADLNPTLAEAASHLAIAGEQLSRGHYRHTVAECRHVLEGIGEVLGDSGQNTDNERLFSKEQRIARINSTFTKLTHLAHHNDDVSRRTEWDYRDARAILMMAGALLQLASRDGRGDE